MRQNGSNTLSKIALENQAHRPNALSLNFNTDGFFATRARQPLTPSAVLRLLSLATPPLHASLGEQSAYAVS